MDSAGTTTQIAKIPPAGSVGPRPVVASADAWYMSLDQTAHYLGGVSKSTVRRWIEALHLPHYHLPSAGGAKRERGRLLFRRREIDRWMRPFRNGLHPHEERDSAALGGHDDVTGAE